MRRLTNRCIRREKAKNMIRDITNSIRKELKELHKRKNRDDKRLFFIEGLRFVKEALYSDAQIKYIVVSESQINNIDKNLLDKVLDVYLATDKVIKELSATDTPQGIIAVLPYLDFVPKKDLSRILILDSLQDPGNMGTIIRTADATNIDGIILSKGCVDIYNPKVLRATMGSIFRIFIMRVEKLEDSIIELKSNGITVLGAHLNASKNYFDIDLRENVAIVIGNEANGISDEVTNSCSELIKIPMMGKIESLNAGVSASVILYEMLRQNYYNVSTEMSPASKLEKA